MKEIQLTRGKVALVDDEDYELVMSASPWYCLRDGYAARSQYVAGTGRSKMVYLHRLLVGAGKGQIVDHVNRDKLDNRRANLRLCTHAQNNCNKGRHRQGASQFKGVEHRPNHKFRPWIASIRGTGQRKKYLGSFATEEEAAKAYDDAATQIHGEFAKLNFKEGA